MSRRDALRQRHRSASPTPRATAGAADVTTADDSKRMDVPQPSAENFAMRVRETLMTMLGRQGDPLDRGVTLRDLIDSGVVTLNPGYSLGGGGNGIPISPGGGTSSNVKPDLTPPPTPTHFQCVPSLTNIFFQTDDPTWAMGHGYFVTNIYGAQQVQGQPPPTYDKAKPLTSFTGSVGSWATAPNTTWFLWCKWETRDGVESINPAGGTNGISVTTGQDVDKLVAAMTGPGEPFKVVPVTTTLPDGSVVPAGTYTADAFIHNGQITNLMVANAAIDTAKIREMAADKISVGNLTAAYIQSPNYNPAANQGWQIRSDGRADFRNVTVSGNIYATDGIFYGVVYARDGYFNGDISAARGRFKGGVMGGAYQGYAWPDGGALGYFLGPRNASDPNSDGGLLLGNANIGHYFQVTYDGNVYAPGLTIINGSASFSGTINIDAGSGTRLVINSQRIEVWEGSTLRVRMGIW